MQSNWTALQTQIKEILTHLKTSEGRPQSVAPTASRLRWEIMKSKMSSRNVTHCQIFWSCLLCTAVVYMLQVYKKNLDVLDFKG